MCACRIAGATVTEFLPLIGAGLAGLVLILIVGCIWLWRALHHYRNHVSQLRKEIVQVAADSTFDRRVGGFANNKELDELGNCFNQLFEAMHTRDVQAKKREEVFKDLANILMLQGL